MASAVPVNQVVPSCSALLIRLSLAMTSRTGALGAVESVAESVKNTPALLLLVMAPEVSFAVSVLAAAEPRSACVTVKST